jgi:hypothetical protein
VQREQLAQQAQPVLLELLAQQAQPVPQVRLVPLVPIAQSLALQVRRVQLDLPEQLVPRESKVYVESLV